ncbi:decapping endonuclease targeting mRNA [Coemansia erecta]|uniref:Decapping nuclease n=1 Tax=Coemansia asiatica TaxID=1052880 RepID=A0A9W7XMU1_9FUNG|nr:decapping endonuclease targeting mRNA [Coemansia asiatica]KAJ2856068.1 decapping endonuclease targeting mRNA [Coemansia erecta]KAJ2881388.1 decapping endonuclease targeting mRNA [Coemansia asiatica]
MSQGKRKQPDQDPYAPVDSGPESSKAMKLPTQLKFSVRPLSKYRRLFPRFSEPKEIISFSYDSVRKQHMDDRELKYFCAPALNPAPSLFDGFEKQIRRDPSINEHIDGLLTALLHLPKQTTADADFVMYRGMLTRLFVTPYSLRDAWSMNATRIGRTIYIEDNVTSEAIENRRGSSQLHEKLMYSGYKFEGLCVLDKPASRCTAEDLAKRRDATVNTHSEYCSVFRTKLGKFSIISGAEIDCIDGEKPSEFPSRMYRELKTANLLDTPRKQESFDRFKLIKFWAQSFIAGIPVVTVGYRDADGVLRHVEDIQTQDMPRRVRGRRSMWEANVCMNFAEQILGFIKDAVKEQGPQTQYCIEYDPQTQDIGIELSKIQTPFLTPEYASSSHCCKD